MKVWNSNQYSCDSEQNPSLKVQMLFCSKHPGNWEKISNHQLLLGCQSCLWGSFTSRQRLLKISQSHLLIVSMATEVCSKRTKVIHSWFPKDAQFNAMTWHETNCSFHCGSSPCQLLPRGIRWQASSQHHFSNRTCFSLMPVNASRSHICDSD